MELRRDLAAFAEPFDVLIIGAGVYGACIARIAARQGLRVALVERDDFGAATSRNSLKLIHGGFRYLQHFDVARIRESISAGRAWRQAAPHLVRPLRCVIPTYGFGTRGPIALAGGTVAYAMLSADRNRGVADSAAAPPGGVFARGEFARRFPELMQARVTGGAYWYDAQMQDAVRLTFSCIADACRYGASVANHVEARELLIEGSRVLGVIAQDRLASQEVQIRARVTINATGPWIARLLPEAKRKTGIVWTRNINLVTRRLFDDENGRGVTSKRKSDAAVGESNRLFFIAPWRDCSLVGTAHERYDGEPTLEPVSRAEVSALVDEFSEAIPAAKLSLADVRSVHVGLTPSENEVSERAKRATVVVHTSADGLQGLISIAGIKYTTAPTLARKVVALAVASAGLTVRDAGDVFSRTLQDAPDPERSEPPAGLDRDDVDVRWVLQTYGMSGAAALGSLRKGDVSTSEHVFRCRIAYGIRHEMAMRLTDALLRLTDNAERGCLTSTQLRWAADHMASYHGWTAERRDAEIANACARLVNSWGSTLVASDLGLAS